MSEIGEDRVLKEVSEGRQDRIRARMLFATAIASVGCSEPAENAVGMLASAGANNAEVAGAAGASGASQLVAPPDTPIELDLGGIQGADSCVGLECQQTTCAAGACTEVACASGLSTKVSGTVYDPSGKLPLYNVMVYVPNGEVGPIVSGPSCDSCELTSEAPLTSALTDTAGHFVLDNVPVGADIPLVMQIGKWRRQVRIPVTPCAENPLSDVNLTRLPRNQVEGNIPLIAIATGAFDSMECLPRRLGIDDAEFTSNTGTGRIHLYHGTELGNSDPTAAFASTLNGGMRLPPATTELWASGETLNKYDLVVLSCEGDAFEVDKPPAARAALYEYASLGGRVFASHWHHIWFSAGPGLVPDVATWEDRQTPETNPTIAAINTAFPKGQAFSEWLVNVGASTVPGQMELYAARDNVQAVNPAYATEWMSIENAQYPLQPKAVEYLSFNAPLEVPPEEQCGRAVYTDLHVSSTGSDLPGLPFPSGCEVRELSPQEKAVAFMLFDLSACVIPDNEPPKPPTIR